MQSVLSGRALGAKPVRAQQRASKAASRTSLVCRADYLGSPTNLIMIASTGAFLAAGRLGLAPTAAKGTTADPTKLVDRPSSGVLTSDPQGFTIVDVLALGALGHVVGVGIVLGLKGTGQI